MIVRRRMRRDIQAERRLPHGRTGRHDDQVVGLETRGQVVQIFEAAGHPGNLFPLRMELFYPLHRGPQHLLQPVEPLRLLELRDLEDLRLGLVQQLMGRQPAAVGLRHDRRGRLDQLPEHRLLPHDGGMGLQVGGRHRRVDQLGQVRLAPGRLQLALGLQLVPQGDVVDVDPAVHQPPHRPEDPPVPFPVEQRIVQQLRRAQRRVAVEQHRAQHRLLRLVAPGRAADRLLGRGDHGSGVAVR